MPRLPEVAHLSESDPGSLAPRPGEGRRRPLGLARAGSIRGPRRGSGGRLPRREDRGRQPPSRGIPWKASIPNGAGGSRKPSPSTSPPRDEGSMIPPGTTTSGTSIRAGRSGGRREGLRKGLEAPAELHPGSREPLRPPGQEGEPEAAEKALREALRQDPKNAEANFNMGLLLAEMGNRMGRRPASGRRSRGIRPSPSGIQPRRPRLREEPRRGGGPVRKGGAPEARGPPLRLHPGILRPERGGWAGGHPDPEVPPGAVPRPRRRHLPPRRGL